MTLIRKSNGLDYQHWYGTWWSMRVHDKSTTPVTVKHIRYGAPDGHLDTGIDFRHWSGAYWHAKIVGDKLRHSPNNAPQKVHEDVAIDYLHWYGGQWRAYWDHSTGMFTHVPVHVDNHKDGSMRLIESGETEVVYASANLTGKVFYIIEPLTGSGTVRAYWTRTGLGSNKEIGQIQGSGVLDIPTGVNPTLKFASKPGDASVVFITDNAAIAHSFTLSI